MKKVIITVAHLFVIFVPVLDPYFTEDGNAMLWLLVALPTLIYDSIWFARILYAINGQDMYYQYLRREVKTRQEYRKNNWFYPGDIYK